MNQVHFTFNNFFDYQIIKNQLKSRKWKSVSSNLTITFNYRYTEMHAVKYIEELCKPLNIQFTTTLGVTEDSK